MTTLLTRRSETVIYQHLTSKRQLTESSKKTLIEVLVPKEVDTASDPTKVRAKPYIKLDADYWQRIELLKRL